MLTSLISIFDWALWRSRTNCRLIYVRVAVAVVRAGMQQHAAVSPSAHVRVNAVFAYLTPATQTAADEEVGPGQGGQDGLQIGAEMATTGNDA
jgi:hypothetical protein